MNDTTETDRDDHQTEERPIPDGGTGQASGYPNVTDRTGRGATTDVPRLGGDGQHLFAPAELPPWTLSVPFVGALAVAIGAQGTAVLASGAGSAWLGTVVATIGLLAVLSLALRSV